MKIPVKYKKVAPEAKLPQLATDGSVGYDVFVCRILDKQTRDVIDNLEKDIEIKPGESILLGSGIAMEIPLTHFATIFSRTGSAVKYDIESGHPGAPIDPDYRGEFTVFIRNVGKESFKVEKFIKIAQLIFIPRIVVEWLEAEKLSDTERGKQGLGHTGLYELKKEVGNEQKSDR